MEFRNKYGIPIILEESISFGVLGCTGKGATEHFNVPVSKLLLFVCFTIGLCYRLKK